MEVKVEYWISGGIGCASPRIPWTVDLTDEEMEIYNNAIENKIPLDEVEGLDDALRRAYDEIVEYEKECAEEFGDEDEDESGGDIKVKFVDPLFHW